MCDAVASIRGTLHAIRVGDKITDQELVRIAGEIEACQDFSQLTPESSYQLIEVVTDMAKRFDDEDRRDRKQSFAKWVATSMSAGMGHLHRWPKQDTQLPQFEAEAVIKDHHYATLVLFCNTGPSSGGTDGHVTRMMRWSFDL